MPDKSVHRRIAVIASNFWPEVTGTSQTVTEFADFLSRAGVEVTVATSMPYYPEWQIWPAYRGRLWLAERRGRLEILRSWHYVSRPPSTLTRLLHEVTLSVLALPSMYRALRDARAAYIVSPALSFAFTAMVLARLLRVERVLVVKDVMPDAAVELGMLQNPLVVAVSRYLAHCLYSWANEIHTLGEGMRRRIARQTGQADKIRIVPDTIDGNELTPVLPADNEFRARFVPPGTFAVLHTGNMGKKQDLDLVLRAARQMRGDHGVRFYVFGDGAAKECFLGLKHDWGLDNVSHYGLQERRMLSHMLSGADVVLVSQLPEVVDIVVPSKLITAMGAGAMIIAACAPGSETERLVRESEGGIWVPASDDAALVREIQRIRAGLVDTGGCRRRARAFALKTFDRNAVYGPLAQRYSTSSWGLPRTSRRFVGLAETEQVEAER